jgi:DNA-binding transcriptional regulator YhcF (GntR family)
MALKDLNTKYREYCKESGYNPCSIRKVGERLRNAGFVIERKNTGMIVCAEKTVNDFDEALV